MVLLQFMVYVSSPKSHTCNIVFNRIRWEALVGVVTIKMVYTHHYCVCFTVGCGVVTCPEQLQNEVS